MKKAVIVTLGLALAAAAAYGALGSVVHSFAAPATYPIALGVPNNYTSFLWVYCNSSPYRIYQLQGTTGSVVASYTSPQGSYTRGLTYSYNGGGGLPTGSYLWMGNSSTDRIYRCNYSNGSVYASIPANHDMYGGIAAMATADGGNAPTYMMSNDTSPAMMYRQSLTSGSIYSSWTSNSNTYDLAWDWRNQIIWTGDAGNRVYGWRTNGSLVTSFTIPNNYPLGFCYTSNYLWVACTIGSPAHYIYQIHCPQTNIGVSPSSVGKIKTLFR
jgi:hypothetical protein